MSRGVLTVITDKPRAQSLLRSSLEGLGYRVVPFEDVRSAAAYLEADIHLLDSGAATDLSADLHRLEESAPVLLLMPPGSRLTPACGQASAGFIAMAARIEEYALRLDIAAASSPSNGYRIAAPHRGSQDAHRAGVPAAGTNGSGPAHNGSPSGHLPPRPPPKTTAITRESHAEASEGQPAVPRVALVADGDRHARHLAIFKLRSLGFEPVEASSGSEALELATGRRLALAVVSDDVPPDGGIDLLERLRTAQAGAVPASILTTSAPAPPGDAPAQTDGVALLVKPFASATSPSASAG